MIEFNIDIAPPRHWDYVLSCFEPITRVTGGIGTYTRLILEQIHDLSIDGRSPNILFFASERQRGEDFSQFCPRASIYFVPSEVHFGSSQVNNLGDPYRHFGLGMMRAMHLMERLGHSFGYFETPDYSAEGYYVLKARRFNLLHIKRTGVRLHSPLFMLHEDNDSLPWCDASAFRFHDMERYCIRHTDDVLFGGDAMRDRVLSQLDASAAQSARRRSIKIPHPWPKPGHSGPRPRRFKSRPKLAYVGRLEYRKGVDLLVEAALDALRATDFELHFFGRDTETWRQTSMRRHLDRAIQGHPKARRFIFHDHVSQTELWENYLPAMDGFIFPSRFENYPNVLLEVLQLGRPTLVSKFGCMPEMGAAFPFVTSIDPFNKEELAAQLIETSQHRHKKTTHDIYSSTHQEMTEQLGSSYASILGRTARRGTMTKTNSVSISFVIAHYNQSRFVKNLLQTLSDEMQPGDEVLVIDDCSLPSEAQKTRRFVESAGHSFLQTKVNSGPSVARNIGIQKARGDAIYILDADDLLEPGSTAILRSALAQHPSLDVVSGFFQAFGDEDHTWASYDPIPETILLENSTHCGILARRGVFDKIGPYASGQREHFEDWELAMRLALADISFEVIPVISYLYRVQKATSRNNTRLEKAGYSYEHAMQRALNSKHVNWRRLAKIIPALIVNRASSNGATRDPTLPREVRYEVADRINLLAKSTPLHSPVKHLIAKALRIRVQ